MTISPISPASASTASAWTPTDYLPEIEAMAARGVVMHCLNPDRMVIRGGVAEACAGAHRRPL